MAKRIKKIELYPLNVSGRQEAYYGFKDYAQMEEWVEENPSYEIICVTIRAGERNWRETYKEMPFDTYRLLQESSSRSILCEDDIEETFSEWYELNLENNYEPKYEKHWTQWEPYLALLKGKYDFIETGPRNPDKDWEGYKKDELNFIDDVYKWQIVVALKKENEEE